MTRIKMLGLCLVAMFAVSAVAASASFAETAPEFFGKGPISQPRRCGGVPRLEHHGVPAGSDERSESGVHQLDRHR